MCCRYWPPRLFPHAEGTGWTRRQEYELPAVAHVNSEINQVEEDARARITVLQQRIERERTEHGHLHDLLTATGAELVVAVIAALKELGFSDVRDIDAETEEEEKRCERTSRSGTDHRRSWSR